MTDAPERIWLLPFDGEQRTWCNDPDPSGLGHGDEADGYIRADIAAAREAELRAEVERLTRALDSAVEAVEQSAINRGVAEAEVERLKSEASGWRTVAESNGVMAQSHSDEAARLRALLDEALNLTVRGRRLDGISRRKNQLDASVNPEEWQASGRFDDFVAAHNATREPWEQIETRSLTPQLWTEDQFQRDLHEWETRARAALAKIGGQHD